MEQTDEQMGRKEDVQTRGRADKRTGRQEDGCTGRHAHIEKNVTKQNCHRIICLISVS